MAEVELASDLVQLEQRRSTRGIVPWASWEQWCFDHSCSGRKGAWQGAGLLGPTGKGRASAVGGPALSFTFTKTHQTPPSLDARDMGSSSKCFSEVGIAKYVGCGVLEFAYVISLKQGKPNKSMRNHFMANLNPGPDPREATRYPPLIHTTACSVPPPSQSPVIFTGLTACPAQFGIWVSLVFCHLPSVCSGSPRRRKGSHWGMVSTPACHGRLGTCEDMCDCPDDSGGVCMSI